MARRKARVSKRTALRKARARLPLILAWAGGLVAGLICIALGWLLFGYPASSGPGQGRAVELTLPANLAPGDLAEELSTQGLVSSPHLFALWTRLSGGVGEVGQVAAGEHLVTDDI